MIRKSGNRFSEKIMHKRKNRAARDSISASQTLGALDVDLSILVKKPGASRPRRIERAASRVIPWDTCEGACTMDSDAGGWLWLVIDVVLVAALAFGLIWGTVMWRLRRRKPALEAAREQATRRLYKRAAQDEREQERRTAA